MGCTKSKVSPININQNNGDISDRDPEQSVKKRRKTSLLGNLARYYRLAKNYRKRHPDTAPNWAMLALMGGFVVAYHVQR